MRDKYVLILGGTFESFFVIDAVKKHNLKVIVIDRDINAPAYKFADVKVVCDLLEYEKALSMIKALNLNIVAILPTPIGIALNCYGYLRDHLFNDSCFYEAIEICTDKYLFHEKLNQDNVSLRCGSCKVVHCIEEGLLCNFPAILKPRFGAGSRDVRYVVSYEDFVTTATQIDIKKEDFILEDFIEGPEYGADYAIVNGKLQPLILRKKIETLLPLRQAIGYICVTDKNLIEKCARKVEMAAKLLKIDNCLLNVDLIEDNNDIFIIEMAPRPSGHYISSNFIEFATKVNPIENLLKLQLNEDYSFTPCTPSPCMIFYLNFERDVIAPDMERIMDKYGIAEYKINALTNLKKVVDGRSIMGRGFIIVKASSENELLENRQKILNLFVNAR